MWWKIALGIECVAVVAVLSISAYGSRKWRAGTEEMRMALETARIPQTISVFDPAELDTLPPVVRRYFEVALRPGQPIISAADIEHAGTFNMSETGEQWRPFTSTQRVVTNRPGFHWDARISMMPGLSAHVHDAYIGGEGVLHASLLGAVTVADMRDTPEMARGELMRYFAESAWYPTALRPSQGVRWEAAGENAARATLEDGAVRLSMLFRFTEEGLIESVYADARERVIGKDTELRPWEGRFSDYRRQDGMMVPMQGEVAWILPDGYTPYWRGTIERISYEYAQ
ncbi:MAG: DUF6920 family protein [Spirochaetia bacterium]